MVYLMGVWSVSRRTLAEEAERVKPGRGESRVGDVVQELIDQGRAEGFEQGFEQGFKLGFMQGFKLGMEQRKVQERSRILTRLPKHRCGSVPPRIRHRIRTATPEELDAKLTPYWMSRPCPRSSAISARTERCADASVDGPVERPAK